MNFPGSNHEPTALAVHPLFLRFILLILMPAGCSSTSIAPRPVLPVAPPQGSRENFQVKRTGGFTLNYQLERNISAANRKSCYFIVIGPQLSPSTKTLRKESVLDFTAMNQGKQAYRDITNPAANIAPGAPASVSNLRKIQYLFAQGVLE